MELAYQGRTMTTATSRTWTATTIPLGLAAVLGLAGCGGERAPASGAAGGDGGGALYATHCGMCHGADGEGSSMGLGPALVGLAGRWDEERLREYLRDPRGYAETHPDVTTERMPAVSSTVTDDELGALARHSLRLMARKR